MAESTISGSRPLRRAAVLLTLTAAMALGSPSAGAAEPASAGSFARDLAGLENAVRNAIERQPEGLLKSVTAAERVCEVGDRAEARGDVGAAEASWSTLDQIVGVFGEPELATVRHALREAGEELTVAQRRFRAIWSQQKRNPRPLASAVRSVRRGIDRVIASLATLQAAFAAWRGHICEAALAAAATADRQAQNGVEAIAIGMQRLWILATVAGEARR